MSLSPLLLGGVCTAVPFIQNKLQNGLEILRKIWALLRELPSKDFGPLKYKILIICCLAKFQFVSDAVWWLMTGKLCFFSF